MSLNYTRSNSPIKGSPPSVRSPHTPHVADVTSVPHNHIAALPGDFPWTIDAFMWLVVSCRDGRFFEADCAQRALRRFGWDVAPYKGGES